MDALRNDQPAGPVNDPADDPAVLADDRLVEDIRTGRCGPDDADPLTRTLVRWRLLVRRPGRRRRTATRRCV